MDQANRSVGGAIENLENFVMPSEPTRSSLAEMAYSELRTTALNALQEGKSPTEARTEGVDAALEELTIPYKNLAHQYNEYIWDAVRYLFAYVDTDALGLEGESDEVDHSDGETIEPFDFMDYLGDAPDGYGSFPGPYNTDAIYDPEEVYVGTEDHLAPNGDTVTTYTLEFYIDSNQTTTVHLYNSGFGTDYNGDSWAVQVSHDGNSAVIGDPDIGFNRIAEAIDDIADDIQSNGGDVVEEIMDAHTAGDVDEMDILSSYDLVREYGDSGLMTRYTAELLAAGLDAQDDITDVVTIDHPDVGERSGRLFLSWDWSELREWEYTYDLDSGMLVVDDRSLDADPELVVSFNEAEDVVLTADDFAGAEGVDTGVTGDEIEAIERDSQGELRSHIPVGEVTSHWNNAIFLYDDGDGGANQQWLDAEEPFELVGVEDEDGNELDSLELNGWENQERDPALALEEAARAESQFVTVDDLEETAHGGGGGGTDTNALLIGGGIIALVGMIIAALSSGDS